MPDVGGVTVNPIRCKSTGIKPNIQRNVEGTKRNTYLLIICYVESLANVMSFNHLGPVEGNLTSLNLDFIWKWGQELLRGHSLQWKAVPGLVHWSNKNKALFALQTLNLGGKESWHLLSLLCAKCFTKIPFNPSSTLWVCYVPICPNDGTESRRGFIITKATQLENDYKIQTQAC